MKAAGHLPTGVDLKNPDFEKMAEAVGILGIRVEGAAGNTQDQNQTKTLPREAVGFTKRVEIGE